MKTRFLLILLSCYLSSFSQDSLFLDTVFRNTVFPNIEYSKYNCEQFIKLPQLDSVIDIDHPDYGLLNAAIFYETNRIRAEYGRNYLQFSPEARNSALSQSYYMIRYNFVSHENSYSGKLKNIELRYNYFFANKFPNRVISEIICTVPLINYTSKRHYYYKKAETGNYEFYYVNNNGDFIEKITDQTYRTFAQAALKSWMGSDKHRKAILTKEFNYLGSSVLIDYRTLHKKVIPMAKATQFLVGNLGK